MISVDDYLTFWRVHYPDAEVPDDELTDEMRRDAQATVDCANQLLAEFGEDRGLTSGWRPRAVNARVPGAAPGSNHVLCRAIDIADPGNALDRWITAHSEILDELGLWRESPNRTAGWVHIQIVQNRSWEPGKSRTYLP